MVLADELCRFGFLLDDDFWLGREMVLELVRGRETSVAVSAPGADAFSCSGVLAMLMVILLTK